MYIKRRNRKSKRKQKGKGFLLGWIGQKLAKTYSLI